MEIVIEFLIMAAYYFSKNWKFANFFISVYTAFALIPFVLILPESPRLIQKKFYSISY